MEGENLKSWVGGTMEGLAMVGERLYSTLVPV